jgi:hypothetical protein
MSFGKNLGMKSRTAPYGEIKKPVPNEAIDKKLAQDLARAEDGGFSPPGEDRIHRLVE